MKYGPDYAVKWFAENRWGMFVHYGLYSLLRRCEWAQLAEEIPPQEYEKLADKFTARNFDALKLAKLAKAAGMTCLCLTTKHHEGFCLFDSKLTDYTSVKAPAGRDLVAEFVDACRAEGLRPCLYYSLMDWHHPDWLALARGDLKGHKRFIDYIHGQLRELFTNYGRIDMLFYDIAAPYQKPEEWRSEEMNGMLKKLQPWLLVNDRNCLPGDFSTPEQVVIAQPEGRAWQTCMTLNENWGYAKGDNLWKSPKMLVSTLRKTAVQGGSLLMNVGPKPDGSIPAKATKILGEVGAWLKRNGEAIYGANDRRNVMCSVGGHTVVGNNAYVFARDWSYPEIGVGGILNKVTRVVCLSNGKCVPFKQDGSRLRLLNVPSTPPDPITTVYRIEVEGKLRLREVNSFPRIFYHEDKAVGP